MVVFFLRFPCLSLSPRHLSDFMNLFRFEFSNLFSSKSRINIYFLPHLLGCIILSGQLQAGKGIVIPFNSQFSFIEILKGKACFTARDFIPWFVLGFFFISNF